MRIHVTNKIYILVVRTKHRESLAENDFKLIYGTEECYGYIPIVLLGRQHFHRGFLDPKTLLVKRHSPKIDCATVELIPVYMFGKLSEFDYKLKIERNLNTNLLPTNFVHNDDLKSTVFKQLIATNANLLFKFDSILPIAQQDTTFVNINSYNDSAIVFTWPIDFIKEDIEAKIWTILERVWEARITAVSLIVIANLIAIVFQCYLNIGPVPSTVLDGMDAGSNLIQRFNHRTNKRIRRNRDKEYRVVTKPTHTRLSQKLPSFCLYQGQFLCVWAHPKAKNQTVYNTYSKLFDLNTSSFIFWQMAN
jgi:hypothetical protein